MVQLRQLYWGTGPQAIWANNRGIEKFDSHRTQIVLSGRSKFNRALRQYNYVLNRCWIPIYNAKTTDEVPGEETLALFCEVY